MHYIPSRLRPFIVRRWLPLLLASLVAGSPPAAGSQPPSSPAADQLGQQVETAREALQRGDEDMDSALRRLHQLVRDLEAAETRASRSGLADEAARAVYWKSVALLELASFTEARTGPTAEAFELFEQAEHAATRAVGGMARFFQEQGVRP